MGVCGRKEGKSHTFKPKPAQNLSLTRKLSLRHIPVPALRHEGIISSLPCSLMSTPKSNLHLPPLWEPLESSKLQKGN